VSAACESKRARPRGSFKRPPDFRLPFLNSSPPQLPALATSLGSTAGQAKPVKRKRAQAARPPLAPGRLASDGGLGCGGAAAFGAHSDGLSEMMDIVDFSAALDF
jgi:hypothetical protein